MDVINAPYLQQLLLIHQIHISKKEVILIVCSFVCFILFFFFCGVFFLQRDKIVKQKENLDENITRMYFVTRYRYKRLIQYGVKESFP